MRTATFARRLVLAILGTWLHAAWAAPYPERPIHLVVPVVPGGPADTAGRLVAAVLAKSLNQTVIVDNKSGASQTIGTRAVMREKPDGYTLMFSTSFPQHPLFATNGVAVGEMLQPAGNLMHTSLMLSVRNDLPIHSVSELIAYAKANPGRLNNSAHGASLQLISALFRERTGTEFSDIPFQGESQAIVAMIGGSIDMAFMSPSITIPYARDGKIRSLMTLGARRSALAPELPTAAESGVKSFSYGINLGLWAPKGTPAAIVQRLNAALAAAATDPAFLERARSLGFEVVASTPQEQIKIYQQEIAMFGEAARIAKFSPR